MLFLNDFATFGGKGSGRKKSPYTNNALRERIKAQVMAGSQGGRPGQWSARKAQILAAKYRSSGGGYKKGKTSAQRSLQKWTKEKWRTSSGKPAIRGDKTYRYLPDAAWKKLSKGQIAATNRKKVRGAGQFVPNTRAAARVGRVVRRG